MPIGRAKKAAAGDGGPTWNSPDRSWCSQRIVGDPGTVHVRLFLPCVVDPVDWFLAHEIDQPRPTLGFGRSTLLVDELLGVRARIRPHIADVEGEKVSRAIGRESSIAPPWFGRDAAAPFETAAAGSCPRLPQPTETSAVSAKRSETRANARTREHGRVLSEFMGTRDPERSIARCAGAHICLAAQCSGEDTRPTGRGRPYEAKWQRPSEAWF